MLSWAPVRLPPVSDDTTMRLLDLYRHTDPTLARVIEDRIELAGLMPGDSGGALVDQNGVVIGVAFAIAPDRPSTAYALTSKELNADLALPRGQAVSTGRCLAD